MAKHTPGPWHIHNKPNVTKAELPWIGGSTGRPIAFITHESVLNSDMARTAANARLIAAAPELLELLKEARAIIAYNADLRDEDWLMLDRISAAIAKAEGA